MSTERDVIKFQIKRQLLATGKVFLELLEDNFNYIDRLEKLLGQAGFEHFKENKLDYNKDRAIVLSKVNDAWRELHAQIEMFDVSLKRD